jgi:hypothetical protein
MQESQIIYRCLQVAVLIFFSLKVAKLDKYIYKGPSNKFLFFHEAFYTIHTSFIPIISSKKCSWKISAQ